MNEKEKKYTNYIKTINTNIYNILSRYINDKTKDTKNIVINFIINFKQNMNSVKYNTKEYIETFNTILLNYDEKDIIIILNLLTDILTNIQINIKDYNINIIEIHKLFSEPVQIINNIEIMPEAYKKSINDTMLITEDKIEIDIEVMVMIWLIYNTLLETDIIIYE